MCGHNQLLAAVTTQRWYRQACRTTIPKVGALALRLRSSDIQNNAHNHTQHNGREHAEGQGKTQFKTYISKIQDKRRGVHETHVPHTMLNSHRDEDYQFTVNPPHKKEMQWRSMVERVKEHRSDFGAGTSLAP